jgi:hypothetical protein
MAAGKLASAAIKGFRNIVRDISPKAAAKSGKKARRSISTGFKPLTKTAQRKNQQQSSTTGKITTEGSD